MRINRSFVFVFAILVIIGLTACTKTLPAPSQAEATATSVSPPEINPPEPTTAIQEALAMSGTQTVVVQTAEAAQALQQTEAAQPTSELIPQTVESTPILNPTPAITLAPLTVPAKYTLKKDEFPFCIARRFNVDWAELLAANGLSINSLFYPGMTLTIPQTGHPFPGTRALHPHPAQYTVRAGDTLEKIACWFGDVDPSAIAAINNLDPNAPLTPGQVLNIP